jgi:hypothetical protein
VKRLLAVVGATLALSGCSLLGVEVPEGEDVFSLAVADCLADADVPDEVTTVRVVDCAAPHDSEIFARTEVDDPTFPGADELEARLAEFCRGHAFTDFIGIPFAESRYSTRGYYPTIQSWGNGDRELLCTVVDESGAPLVGSLRDIRE